jgi:hypothetical protein
LINTPYGFEQSFIDEINAQKNLEEKWEKCIKLAFKRLEDRAQDKMVNAGEIANKKQWLKDILDQYIIKPSQIRNKIAHGQWSVCLNNECSRVNQDSTDIIKELDYVKLDRLFTIYEKYQQCIEDIIESPKAHYRDYYKRLSELIQYIEDTKEWSKDTKKKQLSSSTKADGYYKKKRSE